MEERRKKGFTIKRELDFGDLLTPLSILIALATAFATWQSDRDARLKQYADGIRHSSSTVSAKLERWGTLSDRYFEDIQPTIIAASIETARTHLYMPARTALFRGLREAEGQASQRVVDEQLETAYMELYGYVPSLRPPFDKIREDISTAELASHRRLEDALQEKLRDEELLRSSDSAIVGHALRKIATAERQRLRSEIRTITDPLVANILKIISLSDQDLVDPNKRAAQIAIFNPQTNHQ